VAPCKNTRIPSSFEEITLRFLLICEVMASGDNDPVCKKLCYEKWRSVCTQLRLAHPWAVEAAQVESRELDGAKARRVNIDGNSKDIKQGNKLYHKL
jgi:hypothetical protein